MSAEKNGKNKNPVKKQNPHAGHRNRMRQRFLENGLNGFHEHEILELLLFYVHSQKNTNEIGHNLLTHFGSLKNVLDADYEELLEVEGVGERGAILIKFLPELLRVYNASESPGISLNTFDARCSFFFRQLELETLEVVLLACLNDQLQLQRVVEIARGAPDQVLINPQKLLKTALASKCTNFVMAHNHPMGMAVASYEDVRVTTTVSNLLKSVHLYLVDHIIVADGRSISMLENGSYFTG